MSWQSALKTGQHMDAFSLRRDDCYETPAVAVDALLKIETLPKHLWEPACGPGAIVRMLRQAGHIVSATDLIDYDSSDQDESHRDFLLEQKCPEGVEAILTNPPFKSANQFVAHALDLCPKVIMLLRLAWLEGERRRTILDTGHLARVHVFRNRLPRMHRFGYEGPISTSMVAFAWFVWDKSHSGPTALNRISWVPA